jgi:hypothetical protein
MIVAIVGTLTVIIRKYKKYKMLARQL